MHRRFRIVTAFAAAAFTIAAVPAQTQALDPRISAIMHGQRYRSATWSLLAVDLDSGKTIAQLNADRLAYTGSVRKLFSVSTALETLGATHRFTTPVYRRGNVTSGVLAGDLILVGSGDLTFGGRLTPSGTIEYTTFDHNDANNLGTAILTPQNPLLGLNALARAVRASGITRVRGDVIVDDRLFQPYRVPNGNLLITPILVNENMVDFSLAPTSIGRPASLTWRPATDAFTVKSSATTVKRGSLADVTLSNSGLAKCSWPAPCIGQVSGTLPIGYAAPLSGSRAFVHTFRIEQPASFARIAFVQALKRAGVHVDAPATAPNAESKLPPFGSYRASSRVARFTSPPYAQDAKLDLESEFEPRCEPESFVGGRRARRAHHNRSAAQRTRVSAEPLRYRARLIRLSDERKRIAGQPCNRTSSREITLRHEPHARCGGPSFGAADSRCRRLVGGHRDFAAGARTRICKNRNDRRPDRPQGTSLGGLHTYEKWATSRFRVVRQQCRTAESVHRYHARI